MNVLKMTILLALPKSLLLKMLNYSRSGDALLHQGTDSISAKRLPERSSFARFTRKLAISNEEIWFIEHALAFRKMLQASELGEFIVLKNKDYILDKLVSARKKISRLEAELLSLQQKEDQFELRHWERLKEVEKELGKLHAQTVVLQDALEAKNIFPNF